MRQIILAVACCVTLSHCRPTPEQILKKKYDSTAQCFVTNIGLFQVRGDLKVNPEDKYARQLVDHTVANGRQKAILWMDSINRKLIDSIGYNPSDLMKSK